MARWTSLHVRWPSGRASRTDVRASSGLADRFGVVPGGSQRRTVFSVPARGTSPSSWEAAGICLWPNQCQPLRDTSSDAIKHLCLWNAFSSPEHLGGCRHCHREALAMWVHGREPCLLCRNESPQTWWLGTPTCHRVAGDGGQHGPRAWHRGVGWSF